jgi:SRSO17 transposase
MTDRDISHLGPAFSSYLGHYRGCFLQDRIAGHFDDYCRGLLSDLPRKTVEPIALVSGTAVRTLQEFLVTASWDHDLARDTLKRHLAKVIGTLPADPLGTVGVINEGPISKPSCITPARKIVANHGLRNTSARK